MKKIIALGSMAVGILVLSGCSQQSASQSAPSAPAPASAPALPAVPTSPSAPSEKSAAHVSENSVTIQNFSFSPANFTIKAGTTVTWTNNDSAPHSIKSSSFPSSSNLATGQTYRLQFTTPGTFNYSCGIHPSMLGTITVQ